MTTFAVGDRVKVDLTDISEKTGENLGCECCGRTDVYTGTVTELCLRGTRIRPDGRLGSFVELSRYVTRIEEEKP